MQIKRGRLSMVCVCVVLGFLLALQFRSTRDFNSTLPYQRTEELAARLQQMEKENEVLRQSLDELKEASGVEKYSKFSEDMKMTKQEVKDEYKQSEGDPQVKGKIRRKMQETSMRRMMQDIPQADVVITNPTHFAVAIKYDKTVNIKFDMLIIIKIRFYVLTGSK